jgi:hypothetical protein
MAFVYFLLGLGLLSVIVSHGVHDYIKKKKFLDLFFVVLQSGLMVTYIFIWCLKNVAVG